MIAHAGDLAPWDGGLGVEQFGGQGLDGLPDFRQPYPDRVEDRAIGQIAALQVGADRVDRRLDIRLRAPRLAPESGGLAVIGAAGL